LKDADVVRLDILVADEVVTAFSRVVAHRTLEEEARKAVEKLKNALPRQLLSPKSRRAPRDASSLLKRSKRFART